MENPTDLKSSLKFFFGFSSFKDLQEPIIENLLSNKNTFVIMPTGGGKSLCYQLPAMISDGTALVISPLIALMKNQVDAIRGTSTNDGIAHVLNSSLNKTDTQRVKADLVSGITKLLYVAPESLAKKDTIDFLKKIRISFLAIDEAHCISEWGHDFRPDYLKIGTLRNTLGDVQLAAFTATADPDTQRDIVDSFFKVSPKIFINGFDRPNITM